MIVIQNVVKKLSDYCIIFECVVAGAYLSWMLLPISIPTIFYLLFPILETMAFLFFKDYTPKYRLYYFQIRANLVLWMIAFVHKGLFSLSTSINRQIPIPISMFLYMIVIICGISIYLAGGVKIDQTIKKINMEEIINRIGIPKDDSDVENGDVVLCTDAETGKPVVWKGNDRLLHMFVDGPTGCGKTSQVLIPIALQDVVKNRGVTIMEPKGDFAETAYGFCKIYNRKDAILFNPIDPNCPSFNVLDGVEDQVVETLSTTFQLLTPDSQTYFKDLADVLIRNSLMVVKRLEEAYYNPQTKRTEMPATLITLSDILNNPNRRGEELIRKFTKLPTIDESVKKQNEDVASYFMNEYYKETSITYKNTSGIRTQVSKLIQNKYLRKVLNPEDGKSQINFDEALKNGQCIFISTEQGALGELSSYLGYFFIFNYQAAAFRRKKKYRKKVNYLMIDEAQKFVTESFTPVLEQGRSYRISVTMATQARSELGNGKNNEKLLESISSNARNNVVFPGISAKDREYYEKLFGEVDVVEERKGESNPKFSLIGNMQRGSTETTTYIETTKSLYTGTNLAYKEFSEITYSIVKDSTLQRARDGIAAFIDKGLKKQIDEFIENYENEVEQKQIELEEEEIRNKQKIYEKFYYERIGNRAKSGNGSIPIQNAKPKQKAKKVSVKYD